ncbi:MAG: hypothetical protein RJA14_1337 [Pseudomonadota bacterium]
MKDTSTKLLRFADLKAANIVTNWPQLRRLIDGAGFPAGFLLTPACRVWDQEEIEAWVDARRRHSPARASVGQARQQAQAA